MLENVTAFIISFPQYVPATFASCRLQAPRQDLYGWVLRTKMAAVSNDEAGFDSLLCFMVFHISSQVQLGTGFFAAPMNDAPLPPQTATLEMTLSSSPA